MEGYEEISVSLSDWLTDQGAPGSQHHRLQHLGGERRMPGSVKGERDVMKNTKFNFCPEGWANTWSLEGWSDLTALNSTGAEPVDSQYFLLTSSTF